ncbi:unnamed protein product [Closterium sp. Yama58-4]|nr:unnamed protein product [Closterium sp. Yama58-4]
MDDNKLELTIIRASGLPDVQIWKIGSIQDPYATIKYNDIDLRTKTDKNGGTNPKWNETFSFAVGTSPVISLTVLHERVLSNGELIGTGKVDFSRARELGEAVETVLLETAEGKQQGVLECKLKFPSIWERLHMTQKMSESEIEDDKAVYEKKLADALRMRQKKAAQIFELHENVINGSIASMQNPEPLEEMEVFLEKATTAYLASTDKPARKVKAELDFQEDEFLAQLRKEIDKSEDFEKDIEKYVTDVAEQVLNRRKTLSAAYKKFLDTVKKAEEELLQSMKTAQHEFEVGVEAAAAEYKKDAKTHIYWEQEAKAKKDPGGAINVSRGFHLRVVLVTTTPAAALNEAASIQQRSTLSRARVRVCALGWAGVKARACVRVCAGVRVVVGDMGIAVDRLLEPSRVPEELFCPICNDLIDPADATEVTKCGHVFCGTCINQAMQRSSECPQDRQPITEAHLRLARDHNRFVYRLLGRSRIRCVHHALGCGWTGEVSEDRSHRATCPKERVACTHCSAVVRRDHFTAHAASCQACRKCSEKDAQIATLLQEKLAVSKKFLEVSESLRAKQAQPLGPIQSYHRYNILPLAHLLSTWLTSPPTHPRPDRNLVFESVKRCHDDAQRYRYEDPCGFDSQLLLLLAAANATEWFSENQKGCIRRWLWEVSQQHLTAEPVVENYY